jgi:hypothetical protein
MATPLYSAHISEVFSRAVVLGLSSMGADPAQEDLTHDLGLQLLLEAHHWGGLKPARAEDAAIFDKLYEEMFPRSLTLPADDPAAKRIASSGEYEGRKLLSSTPLAGQIVFSLERNYRAFSSAAQHYIYYVEPVGTSPAAGENGGSVTLAIAGRFPWLFSALRPGLLWESTVFSFAMYA